MRDRARDAPAIYPGSAIPHRCVRIRPRSRIYDTRTPIINACAPARATRPRSIVDARSRIDAFEYGRFRRIYDTRTPMRATAPRRADIRYRVAGPVPRRRADIASVARRADIASIARRHSTPADDGSDIRRRPTSDDDRRRPTRATDRDDARATPRTATTRATDRDDARARARRVGDAPRESIRARIRLKRAGRALSGGAGRARVDRRRGAGRARRRGRRGKRRGTTRARPGRAG